ncbi:hypothetical protein D3C81_1533850 [compost metagenome]
MFTGYIPERQFSYRQGERNRLRFASAKADFLKAFQLLQRASDPGGQGLHIQLNDFIAVHAAAVLKLDAQADGIVLLQLFSRKRQLLISNLCVAQAMAERVQRFSVKVHVRSFAFNNIIVHQRR